MSINFNIVKKSLHQKTGQRRQELERQVSHRALASTAPNNLLPDMILERRTIASLRAATKRARKSDPAQLERVMKSIRSLRQSMPVLIDQSGRIINGHIIATAMKALGETEVLCVVIDHLGEDEKDLLHVALNRIAECGEWDMEELGSLLVNLDEIDMDLSCTGFSLPELDILMTPPVSSESTDEEEVPELPILPVSSLGDLWLLHEHRLLCGDATVPENYALVLDGELAHAIFTDCPWNIPIEGFVSGLGKKKHKNFKMGAGEWSVEEFTAFTDGFSQLCADHLRPGGVLFSCIDWRSVEQIISSGGKAGLKLINLAVWNKGSGGMGSYLRSAHELIPIFCKGDKPALNNVELGKHGRYRSNVWNYPGANRRGSSASEALKHHPTPKPIEMVGDALLDVTRRGDIVFDPFLGSGTTLLAAEKCGRKARAIELDPAYVDVCIRRWEDLTGKQAIHLDTGLSFQEITAERSAALEQ